MKWLNKHNYRYLGKIHRNEKGSVQEPVIFWMSLVYFLFIAAFLIMLVKYLITVNALSDIADTAEKIVNVENGFTINSQQYIEEAIVSKGLDLSRTTISGTESGNFGDILEFTIEYNYPFVNFNFVNEMFPTTERVDVSIPITRRTTALGVVRE